MTDTERLNFLSECVEGGVVDAAFELDGGIYLHISDPTPQEFVVREANNLREAIDEMNKKILCGDSED